jgi:hypothetical protein
VDELGFAGRALSAAELEAIRRNGNGTGYLQVPDTEQGASLPFRFQGGGITANTTSETSLVGSPGSGSVTIPANHAKIGSRFSLVFGLNLSTSAAPGNVTIRVKVGGETLLTATYPHSGSMASVARTLACHLDVTAAGTSGAVRASLDGLIEATGSGTLNTTIANAVDITWQWATADAGNAVTVLISHGVQVM